MKKRSVIIFLFIFLISCTPKQISNEPSQNALPEQNPLPKQVALPAPAVESPKVLAAESPVTEKPNKPILIRRYSFSPSNAQVPIGQQATWEVDDPERFHMIACYKSVDGINKRLFTSERLYHQESFSFAFDSEGKYLCIDPVFGIRGNVTVIAPLIPVTGSFVSVQSVEGFGKSVFLLVGLVVIIALVTIMSQYHRLYQKPVKKEARVNKKRR